MFEWIIYRSKQQFVKAIFMILIPFFWIIIIVDGVRQWSWPGKEGNQWLDNVCLCSWALGLFGIYIAAQKNIAKRFHWGSSLHWIHQQRQGKILLQQASSLERDSLCHQKSSINADPWIISFYDRFGNISWPQTHFLKNIQHQCDTAKLQWNHQKHRFLQENRLLSLRSNHNRKVTIWV